MKCHVTHPRNDSEGIWERETMKYTIKYIEGDAINKEAVIEAETPAEALVTFWIEHPQANDYWFVNKEAE